MLNFFGEKSTVSDILSTIVLGIYDVWNLQCSISGPMYQASSPRGDHDALQFGLLLITMLVPGGDNDVQL